ncbi:MAG: hypothetical protein RR543_03860 [Erysipelotrichales bacterium]
MSEKFSKEDLKKVFNQIGSTEYFVEDYEQENYLFKKNIKEVREYLDIISNNLKDYRQKQETAKSSLTKNNELFIDNSSQTSLNNIISVIGERGSGKSSFLGSLRNSKCIKEKYFFLPTIDPNVFSDSLSILEVLNSQLYSIVKAQCSNEQFRSELYNKLTELTSVIADVRISEGSNDAGYFYAENNSYAILSKLDKRVKIQKLFEETVNITKNIVGDKELVVIIDDIDLVSYGRIYSMLEDIRKYISHNFIVVLSYNKIQLHQSVLNHYLNESSNLLKEDYINNEGLSSRADLYLEKLCPVEYRTFLTSIEEILELEYFSFFKQFAHFDNLEELLRNEHKYVIEKEGNSINNTSKKYTTVEEYIIKVLKAKLFVNINPFDNREKTFFQIASNLRSLIDFLYIIIFDFEETLFYTNNVLKYDKSALLNNIDKNIQYTVNKNSIYFSSQQNQLLNDLIIDSNNEKRNYMTYSFFIGQIHNEELLMNILDSSWVKQVNYTVGDVIEATERYKSSIYKTVDFHFVYVVKSIYNLLLTKYFLCDTLECGSNFDKYLKLCNSKITPDFIKYYRLSSSEYYIKYDSSKDDEGIVDSMIFSTEAALGEVYSSARKRKENKENNKNTLYTSNFNPQSVTTSISYSYRPILVSYSSILNRNAEYKYFLDPFSRLVSKKYIESEYKDGESFYNTILFTNLFLVDSILTNTFFRSSEKKDRHLYLLENVNKFLSFNNYDGSSHMNNRYNSYIICDFFNDNKSGVLFKNPENICKSIISEENIEIINDMESFKKRKMKKFKYSEITFILYANKQFNNTDTDIKVDGNNSMDLQYKIIVKLLEEHHDKFDSIIDKEYKSKNPYFALYFPVWEEKIESDIIEKRDKSFSIKNKTYRFSVNNSEKQMFQYIIHIMNRIGSEQNEEVKNGFAFVIEGK